MEVSKTARLIEDIAARIRDRIASGDYPPGRLLKQEELAKEFDVSRTPIREALSRLEAQGIISQEQRRSAIVRTASPRDITENYQIRAELEGLSARLAARWITDQQLVELRQAHDQFVAAVTQLRQPAQALSRPDAPSLQQRQEATRRWIHTNGVFHGAIITCSHNDKLKKLLLGLRSGYTESTMATSAFGMDLHRMEANIRHHETILLALEARDPARANAAMRDHVRESGDYIVGLLQRLA